MFYHSTRGQSARVDSAQAVLEGLAPDGGLYMPESLPSFDWKACLEGSSMDMSTAILSALLPDIPNMPQLVKNAYTGKFETEDLTPPFPWVVSMCWSCSAAPPPLSRMWLCPCSPSSSPHPSPPRAWKRTS